MYIYAQCTTIILIPWEVTSPNRLESAAKGRMQGSSTGVANHRRCLQCLQTPRGKTRASHATVFDIVVLVLS